MCEPCLPRFTYTHMYMYSVMTHGFVFLMYTVLHLQSSAMVSPEGLRLSRLEVARVLRERNEYKEKYLSLLEQVRMNDELYLFKKKEKKSKWFD